MNLKEMKGHSLFSHIRCLMMLVSLLSWNLIATSDQALGEDRSKVSKDSKDSKESRDKIASKKKVKVLYKSHSEVNFAGNTVQGKLRIPEIIYIFQRKRSQGHQVIRPPQVFHHHKKLSQEVLAESLSR